MSTATACSSFAHTAVICQSHQPDGTQAQVRNCNVLALHKIVWFQFGCNCGFIQVMLYVNIHPAHPHLKWCIDFNVRGLEEFNTNVTEVKLMLVT